jgi:adenine/guanine phosphoribosyltransferase-like PRPP-binding protein
VTLVREAGARPVGLSVLLELGFLGGRAVVERVHPDLDVHTLLAY